VETRAIRRVGTISAENGAKSTAKVVSPVYDVKLTDNNGMTLY
jgi:hypothetical protein